MSADTSNNFQREPDEDSLEEANTAIVYHELYDARGFSRLTRSWGRYRAGFDKFKDLGLIAPGQWPGGSDFTPELAYYKPPFLPVYRPDQATEAELGTVHSQQYIDYVKAMDARGEGFFDRNDTPAWHGVYRRAATAVGGTLLGANLIGEELAQHVFHPAGGLHHAKYEQAAGFCIFNDIVAAVRRWQNHYGFKRIAILDVDGHHGDGTQSLLYREPVLTVSIHQYDGRFYPRTGALTERGEGAGLGYALNLPLPRFTTDEDYIKALEIALAEIERYRPQALILQYGVDAHFTDRMVGLKISTRVYEKVAMEMHELAHRICEGRLLVVGGGGYEPDTVSRCWGILLAQISGRQIELGEAYDKLHDQPENFPPENSQTSEKVRLMLDEYNQIVQ